MTEIYSYTAVGTIAYQVALFMGTAGFIALYGGFGISAFRTRYDNCRMRSNGDCIAVFGFLGVLIAFFACVRLLTV